MDNTLTPQMIQQFNQASGFNVSPTGQPPVTSRADEIMALGKSATPAPVTPATPNLGDYSADAITGGVNKIKSAVMGGANDISQGTAKGGLGGAGQVLKGVGESALGTASGFLQTLFSPVTAVVNDAASHISDNPIVQKIATSGFGDAIQNGEDGFNKWATAHPELATNLSDALNVGLATLGDKLAGSPDIKAPDFSQIKSDLGNLKDTATNLVGGAKDKIMGTASNIKEAISPTLTPEEQVGKIIQGKPSDIPAAQRTFSTLPFDVNPSKMTPAELSDAIQTKINSNMNEVDTHFANDNNPHPMSDFEQTTGKGASAVKTNYVQQAIDQLKDFYTKTNDAQGLSDIKALENKALGEPIPSDKPIYHATDQKFSKFNTNKMEGNQAWFTDNKADFANGNSSGSVGTKNVMERYIKPGLKFADEKTASKLYTDQLIKEGYAGKVVEQDGSKWYSLFDPNKDTLLKPSTDLTNPSRLTGEGLTSKELNDLAKEHGSTIKAFNANGEAASGLSKQAAENTRAGVKTTARNVLSETNPEGAAEVTRLDKETSDAIKTQELLDKQTEKEAVTTQKKGKTNAVTKKINALSKKYPITSKIVKIGAGAAVGKTVGGTGGEAIGAVLGGGL